MILVDSSVWIDYLRGRRTPQAEKLDALLGSTPLAIGDLILTEVLQAAELPIPTISQPPAVVMVIGVNGAGKTRTSAPFAQRHHRSQDHRHCHRDALHRRWPGAVARRPGFRSL